MAVVAVTPRGLVAVESAAKGGGGPALGVATHWPLEVADGAARVPAGREWRRASAATGGESAPPRDEKAKVGDE